MHKAEFTEMAQNKTISCKMVVVELVLVISTVIKNVFLQLPNLQNLAAIKTKILHSLAWVYKYEQCHDIRVKVNAPRLF